MGSSRKEFLPLKMLLLLSILYCGICNAYPTFAEYCVDFNKSYSPQEYAVRQNIYNVRVANFPNITSCVPGVNNLTDWTEQEISELKRVQVLQESERNPAQEDNIPLARVGAASSLSWKDKGKVTTVKNQGSCGSCWSFAAAATAESKLIMDGKYSQWSIDLSEQYLLECTTHSSCDGGYLENAMEKAKNTPKESSYPYSPYNSYYGICQANGIEVGKEVENFYGVSSSNLINLLQDGPLAISIASEGWEYYGSGVFSCSSSARIDHAVLLVGYTSSYWIVKNQWGSSWGMSGYIYVSRSSYSNCGIGYSAHRFISQTITRPFILALFLFLILQLAL